MFILLSINKTFLSQKRHKTLQFLFDFLLNLIVLKNFYKKGRVVLNKGRPDRGGRRNEANRNMRVMEC